MSQGGGGFSIGKAHQPMAMTTTANRKNLKSGNQVAVTEATNAKAMEAVWLIMQWASAVCSDNDCNWEIRIYKSAINWQ